MDAEAEVGGQLTSTTIGFTTSESVMRRVLHWSIRLALTAVVILSVCPLPSAAAPTQLFTITKERSIARLDSATYVLNTSDRDVPVNEILHVPDSLFRPTVTVADSETFTRGWIRLRITNASDRTYLRTLRYNMLLDSVDAYVLANGMLTPLGTTGTDVRTQDRLIPMHVSWLEISVRPGDTLDVYSYCRTEKPRPLMRLGNMALSNTHLDLGLIVDSYSLQAFFSGILFVFVIISLVMYWSFRDRVFLFYALMLLTLNINFLHVTGMLKTYLLHEHNLWIFGGNQWIIALTILFSALFVQRYLDLGRLMPKHRWIYVGGSIYLSVFAIVHGTYLSNEVGLSNLLNYQVFPWVLFTLYLVVRLTIKGHRPARVLLISMSPLAVGTLLYTAMLLGLVMGRQLGLGAFQIGSVLFSGTLLYGLSEKIREMRQERLAFQIEKERSDAVLFNVLPEDVATELKETGESPARSLERVTVLFTDFQEFTSISATMQPQEVVAELNTLFSAFDAIVRRYGLERIKTIGDSYMAAGGLRDSMAHEAHAVVRAAIEMQAVVRDHAAERTASGRAALLMRAGIHTGPVVAGVVGVDRLQYDIWGGTVNTASRMETSGVVGRVNVSEDTYRLIEHDSAFRFEERGMVEAKGLGMVPMWLVDLAE